MVVVVLVVVVQNDWCALNIWRRLEYWSQDSPSAGSVQFNDRDVAEGFYFATDSEQRTISNHTYIVSLVYSGS